ncbi:hypothetical protein ACFL5V_09265 [Fibrobacterota bacterium]
MNNYQKIDFLIHPEILQVLEEVRDLDMDDLELANSRLLRNFSAGQKTAILEQRFLRKKSSKKFSFSHQLIFTRLGLEQSTREIVSRYKAGKIGQTFSLVADLCCGIGGDSFFLQSKVCGVDLDPAILKAYKFNMQRIGKKSIAVRSDVNNCCIRADMAMLDPARRLDRHAKRWDSQNLSPSVPEIQKLINKYGNMVIKLPPGMDVPGFLLGGELEYLGVRDDCLELAVWLGGFGRAGHVTASELESGVSLSLNRHDVAGTFGNIQSPGKYLYEPVKVLVRSHLFGFLAGELGLCQIDPGIAFLSGDRFIKHPMVKPYRILKELPNNMKTVKKALKEFDIGQITVKKRGSAINTEYIRKTLNPRGSLPGVLIFTRVMNRKTVFLTEPLLGSVFLDEQSAEP